MKIGILTFHCAHNYGAVLQTYALQEFLKTQGHDAGVINYRPDSLTSPYALFQWSPLKGLSFYRKIRRLFLNAYLFLTSPLRYFRRKGFERFIKENLNLIKIDAIKDHVDAVIIGSDQVWNPEITKGFDDCFWGDFSSPCKKIVYAASAGAGEKTLNVNKELVQNKLENFVAISVRENSLKDLLEPFTDKPIQLVLDPTLLVGESLWNKKAIRPKEKKYVLIYQMIHNKGVYKIAKKIAKELNAKIIELTPQVDKHFLKSGVRAFSTPEEFLGYFKYAECVVTTSFHGVAFSVINRKSFYYIGKGHGAENRVRTILSKLNLQERLILAEEFSSYSGVDYSVSEDVLQQERLGSKSFLFNALKVR